MPAAAPPPPVNRWQFVPLLMLLVFAVQCIWVASHAPLDSEEQRAVSAGPTWENKLAADDPAQRGDPFRGPLFYRIARLPQRIGLVTPFDFAGPMYHLRARLRLPFILIGILFGGSLWYV